MYCGTESQLGPLQGVGLRHHFCLPQFIPQPYDICPTTQYRMLRGPSNDRVLDHKFNVNNSPGIVFQVEFRGNTRTLEAIPPKTGSKRCTSSQITKDDPYHFPAANSPSFSIRFVKRGLKPPTSFSSTWSISGSLLTKDNDYCIPEKGATLRTSEIVVSPAATFNAPLRRSVFIPSFIPVRRSGPISEFSSSTSLMLSVIDISS